MFRPRGENQASPWLTTEAEDCFNATYWARPWGPINEQIGAVPSLEDFLEEKYPANSVAER